MDVDFFYGLGSRYSYLAATQIAALERDTGATVNWHPIPSGRLMERGGRNPFQGPAPSGQYDWDFRRRDAEAWAAYYGVPYREPHGRVTYDGSLLALACIAARRMGAVVPYSVRVFALGFVEDRTAIGREDLIDAAPGTGLDAEAFERMLDDPATAAEGEAVLDDAFRRGAFGVPTFFVDGQMFWGNDRLVLVRNVLKRRRG